MTINKDEEEYVLSFDEMETEPGVYQADDSSHCKSWFASDNDVLYVVVLKQRGVDRHIPLAVIIDGNSYKPRDIRHIDVFSGLRSSVTRFRKLDHIDFSMVFSLKENKDE